MNQPDDPAPNRQDPALTVDARGLACPLPVLRAARILRDREAGTLVELLATDPAAEADMAVFCREAGHVLLESGWREDGVLRVLIRAGGYSTRAL